MTSKIYRGLSLGNSIDFIPLHQEINHFHKVKMDEENKIILYQDDDEITRVSVRFADEDLWLTQNQLAEIYSTTKQNISQHIDNILNDGELDANRTVKDFLTVRQEVNVRCSAVFCTIILTWLSPWAIVCSPKWLLVSVAGPCNGFMSISKRDLRWMMRG